MNAAAPAKGQLNTIVACSYTKTGTSLTVRPPMRSGVANALTANTKTSKDPAAAPGRLIGTTTSLNVRSLLAPKLPAASSMEGFMLDIDADRDRTMKGISTSTKAIRTPGKLYRSCAWIPNWSRTDVTRPLFRRRIIQPSVRTTTLVSSGTRVMTVRTTFCQGWARAIAYAKGYESTRHIAETRTPSEMLLKAMRR